MITYNCGICPNEGYQVIFDTVEDFEKFEKKRYEKREKHTIRGFVKEINQEVLFHDEYNVGIYEWFVVNGPFLNYHEPLSFHPLKNYLTV